MSIRGRSVRQHRYSPESQEFGHTITQLCSECVVIYNDFWYTEQRGYIINQDIESGLCLGIGDRYEDRESSQGADYYQDVGVCAIWSAR